MGDACAIRYGEFGSLRPFPSLPAAFPPATAVRYRPVMGAEQETAAPVTCPHCHKAFTPRQVAQGPRQRGWKCPHCKLFVPETRTEDAPISRDDSR